MNFLSSSYEFVKSENNNVINSNIINPSSNYGIPMPNFITGESNHDVYECSSSSCQSPSRLTIVDKPDSDIPNGLSSQTERSESNSSLLKQINPLSGLTEISPSQVSSSSSIHEATSSPARYDVILNKNSKTSMDCSPIANHVNQVNFQNIDSNNNNIEFVNIIKPRCTPAREAVDPAKYFILTDEPDGTKYACSKCGNVYKWRKSLNKHWKEKHDGEAPPSLADREKILKCPPQSFQKHSQIHLAPIASSVSKNLSFTPTLPAFTFSGLKTDSLKIPINYANLFNTFSKINSNNGNINLSKIQLINSLPWISSNFKLFNNKNILVDKFKQRIEKVNEPLLAHSHFPTKFNNDGVLDLSKSSNNSFFNDQEHPLDYSIKSQSDSIVEDIPNDLRMSTNIQRSNLFFVRCKQCSQIFNTMPDLNQHFVSQHINALYEAADDLIPGFETKTKDSNIEHFKIFSKEGGNLSCVICGLFENWQWKLSKHFETDHSGIEPNPYKHSLNSNSACKFLNTDLKSPEFSLESVINHLKEQEILSKDGFNLQQNSENLMQTFRINGNNIFNIDSQGTAIVIPKAPEETEMLCSKPLTTNIISKFTASDFNIGKENGISDFGEDYQTDNKFNVNQQKSNKGKKDNGMIVDVVLPYECKLCGYRARWPSEMTQHMKNHSDEKPYQCPQCSYRSKWKWDVVKHLKRCGGNKESNENFSQKRKKAVFKGFPETINCENNQDMSSHSTLSLTFSNTSREVLSKGPPNVTLFSNEKPFRQELENTSNFTSETTGSISDTTIAFPTITLVSEQQHQQQHLNIHPCDHCHFIGHSPAELKRHLRVHSDEKPYSCKSCGYSSKWKCDLKKHIRTYNHTPVIPLLSGKRTDDSNLSFQNEDMSVKNQVKLLEADVSPDGLIKCRNCEFKTLTLTILIEHQMKHCLVTKTMSPMSDEKLSLFDEEKEVFLKYFDLKKIEVNKHPNNDYSNCSIENSKKTPSFIFCSSQQPDNSCIKPSQVIKLKKNHLRVTTTESDEHSGVSKRKRKLRTCSKCEYVTDNLTTLQRHYSKHGNGGRYICVHCDYSVDRQHVLENHMSTAHLSKCNNNNINNDPVNIETENAKKTNPYEPCNPIFDISNPNTISMRNCKIKLVKKNKRQLFGCMNCPYISGNSLKTVYHSRQHGGLKNFKCSFCDFGSNQSILIEKHISSMHKKINQSDYKKFIIGRSKNFCTTCGYTSSNRINVIRHKLIKPCFHFYNSYFKQCSVKNNSFIHICNSCSFKTDEKFVLLNHMKAHGSFSKFSCNKCDFSSNVLNVLYIHERNQHKLDK